MLKPNVAEVKKLYLQKKELELLQWDTSSFESSYSGALSADYKRKKRVYSIMMYYYAWIIVMGILLKNLSKYVSNIPILSMLKVGWLKCILANIFLSKCVYFYICVCIWCMIWQTNVH